MPPHECKQTETLEDIRLKLSEILHNCTRVTVKNGGGRMIEMERTDFDQMVYDKAKEMTVGEAVKKGLDFSGKLLLLINVLQTLIFIGVAIWKVK